MHLVKGEDGTMTYKRRVEEVSQHQINLTEMASFMDVRAVLFIQPVLYALHHMLRMPCVTRDCPAMW